MKWHRKVLVDLINRIPRKPDEKIGVVEVGVSGGKTSQYILRHCEFVHLWMVDRYRPPEDDEQYAKSNDLHANLSLQGHLNNLILALERTAEYADRRTIVVGESFLVGNHLSTSLMDVVFVDADHTYWGSIKDFEAWYHVADSLYCGHNYDPPQADNGVYMAVEKFTSTRMIEIEEPGGGMFAIWKTKP